jgi:hypothetical protein
MESRTMDDDLEVISGPVLVDSGMKISMGAQFQKGDGFEGEVGLRLSLLKARDGKEERVSDFLAKQPNQSSDGWLVARATTDPLPAAARNVRLHVAGTFRGMVRIRGITLQRK